MIVKKEKKNGIEILYVKKDKTDEEMDKIKNTLVKSAYIHYIINIIQFFINYIYIVFNT